jgi:hypothetical protein
LTAIVKLSFSQPGAAQAATIDARRGACSASSRKVFYPEVLDVHGNHSRRVGQVPFAVIG